MLDRALYIRGFVPPTFANGLAVAVVSAKSQTTPMPAFAAESTTPLLYSFVCGVYTDNQVHVVLAWTDPPGNQASMMQLVNDLDLIVVTPNTQVRFFVPICCARDLFLLGNDSVHSHEILQIFGNTVDLPDTHNNVEKAPSTCLLACFLI